MNTNNFKVLIFDSECLMCNKFIIFANKISDNLLFSSLNSSYSKELLKKYNFNEIESFIYYEDNQIYFYSSAFIKILVNSKYIIYRIIGQTLKIFPAIIRDFVYKKIASNRYFISKYFRSNFCVIDIQNKTI
jgi:predicted DCC family thiol-disulfide oxidoreductase YuxK